MISFFGLLNLSATATPQDTVVVKSASDTLLSASDTLNVKKSSLEAPVFSQGRDSTIYDMSGQDRKVYYYGDVTVTYGNMELKAEYMEYNTADRTVYACGVKDSTGTVIGAPVMKEGEQNYTMESIYYNFDSGKARINNVITQEGDGYLHGTVIKKMPDNSINIKGGKYTTCDHEHPHFYLQMSQARVLQSPKQTVFGPSYLVLEDVPLFPLMLPFGFVPDRSNRSGGILFPTFTDEANRGFAIQGLGYYFVMGDYADLSLTTDFFTRGSWRVRATSRYMLRYKFTGNFDVDYALNATGEKGSADYNEFSVFGVRWNHTQDPKARPGTLFSASVNFSSTAYNTYESMNPSQAMQNTASSSISYRKSWEGSPFNLSISLNHSQSMRDSSYALTLPNFTFTMNRIYPFKIKNRVGKERWYEQFAFNYGTTFDNRINFRESQLGSRDFREFMTNGMRHDFGITLPTIRLLQHIQISPSVTYGMNWFFQSSSKQYNDSLQQVVTDKTTAFSEFHLTNTYSFGLSMSTRLYGLFQFGQNAYIRAFRHMITPTLSASFRPELGTYGNGWRTLHYVDNMGVQRSQDYNIFEGQPNGYPSKGKVGSLSFSLNNNLEMKVRDKSDTTGTGDRKIKLIDNLSASASYNFFADSMHLSNINVSANTTVFEKMSINGNMMFDPYAINARGLRYNKLTAPRLMSAGVSFGYQFSGGEAKKSGEGNNNQSQSQPIAVNRYHPETGEFVMTEWLYYADFNAPWSFGFNYGYTYNRQYQYTNEQLIVNHNHMQTLGFSGQLQLTKAMNIRVSSGFDMKEFKLTTTTFDLHYDLHCFEFIFNWVPSGQWQQWSFRINAKAGALADLLKYDKRTSFWDY